MNASVDNQQMLCNFYLNLFSAGSTCNFVGIKLQAGYRTLVCIHIKDGSCSQVPNLRLR